MESKKINVQEFVNKYQSAKTDVEKTKLLNSINIKAYVPFSVKVIHSETLVKTNARRVSGVLLNNSPNEYLMYIMSVISLYTDLQVSKERPHEDYDSLRASGLIDKITESIGKDLEEFSSIFKMVVSDLYANEKDNYVFIASQITRLMEVVEKHAGIANELAKNKEFMRNFTKIQNMLLKPEKVK